MLGRVLRSFIHYSNYESTFFLVYAIYDHIKNEIHQLMTLFICMKYHRKIKAKNWIERMKEKKVYFITWRQTDRQTYDTYKNWNKKKIQMIHIYILIPRERSNKFIFVSLDFSAVHIILHQKCTTLSIQYRYSLLSIARTYVPCSKQQHGKSRPGAVPPTIRILYMIWKVK
jgi:hypothetical protein